MVSPVLVEHLADLLPKWTVKSLPTLPLAQAIKKETVCRYNLYKLNKEV